MIRFKRLAITALFIKIGIMSNLCLGETFAEYAARCETEIGIPIPAFNCDQGTVVPTTLTKLVNGVLQTDSISETAEYTPSQLCDAPNKLSGMCDPGSRWQVISNSPEGFVVAHCRRKGNNPVQGSTVKRYSDIAVAAYNKTTGASCLTQGPLSAVTGQIPALTSVTSSWGVAGSGCHSCHSTSVLLRSNYLAQIKTGLDVVPGKGSQFFGKSDPYYIVGSPNLKSYHVVVNGPQGENKCIGCHSLSGVAEKDPTTGIISSWQSLAISNLAQAAAHNKPSSAGDYAPMWMPPNQINPATILNNPTEKANATNKLATNMAAAQEMLDCSNAISNLVAQGNVDWSGGGVNIDLYPSLPESQKRFCGITAASQESPQSIRPIFLGNNKCLGVGTGAGGLGLMYPVNPQTCTPGASNQLFGFDNSKRPTNPT